MSVQYNGVSQYSRVNHHVKFIFVTVYTVFKVPISKLQDS